jgi:pimeloyl-ACP methyl ester carboxylesterase
MRGIGLSDRGPEPPVLELQMDDVRAVMDAAGSDTAAIFGGARGGAMTLLFAATYPERARALILYAPFAKTVRAPDWPFGRTEEEQQLFFDRFTREMGTGENLDLQGPSHDERFKQWWARFERLGASPGAWRELAGRAFPESGCCSGWSSSSRIQLGDRRGRPCRRIYVPPSEHPACLGAPRKPDR